jgi:hypothetical protein
MTAFRDKRAPASRTGDGGQSAQVDADAGAPSGVLSG